MADGALPLPISLHEDVGDRGDRSYTASATKTRAQPRMRGSRGYHERMKIHLASVAVLVFGVAFGCTAETSEAGSNSTSPLTNEPSQEAENAAAHKVENINASSAAKLLAENGDVVVLDIRTPAEFELSHLKGAVNIDYRAADFADKLGELDKDKTYLVH